jgi:hypothetical protein
VMTLRRDLCGDARGLEVPARVTQNE